MTPNMQKIVKAMPPAAGHAAANRVSFKKAKTGDHHLLAWLWARACWISGMGTSEEKAPLDAVMAEPQGGEEMAAVFNAMPAIKFVLPSDIFAAGVSAKRGLHAESRILRYLAIKHFRCLIRGEKIDKPEPTIEATFKKAFGGRLHMGSSRPACLDCSTVMDLTGVHHESRRGKRSDSEHEWIHPFSLDDRDETDIGDVAEEQVRAQANR
jgi:hypothetical protein